TKGRATGAILGCGELFPDRQVYLDRCCDDLELPCGADAVEEALVAGRAERPRAEFERRDSDDPGRASCQSLPGSSKGVEPGAITPGTGGVAQLIGTAIRSRWSPLKSHTRSLTEPKSIAKISAPASPQR